jgi:hypothetical protein
MTEQKNGCIALDNEQSASARLALKPPPSNDENRVNFLCSKGKLQADVSSGGEGLLPP